MGSFCGALCGEITDEDRDRVGKGSGYPPQSQPQEGRAFGEHHDKNVQRAFDAVDTNGDGYIDKHELQAATWNKARAQAH